ncbi:MAG: hypothetical protein ACYTEL_16210 [Planctomycetota bacterium]|jgi:hypothetical protein
MHEHQGRKKRRRQSKRAWMLAAPVVIALAAFLLLRLSMKSRLQRRFDAIRAAGYPVTCAELNQWYSIPNGVENAADLLAEAFWSRQPWSKEDRAYLPVVGHRAERLLRSEALDEEIRILAAEYLADNDMTLKLLHQAATVEHCRFPVDFTKGSAARLSHLVELRELGSLLKIQTIVAAENDEPALAAASIHAGFGLARSLSNGPMLISQLIRIAVQALAVSGLERAINWTELTPAQLLSLAQTIKDAEDPNAMSRAFAGNRCWALDFFNSSLDEQVKQFRLMKITSSKSLLLLYSTAGFADKDVLRYLEVVSDCVRISRLPLHQRQEAAQAVEDKLKSIPRIQLFLRVLRHMGVGAIIVQLRGIAHLRAARTALALERYRLANGKLPEILETLVPGYLDAIPKDPFDGNDLRYKKLDKGFVVYSIGEDQTDHGGQERDTQGDRKGAASDYDITFTVER